MLYALRLSKEVPDCFLPSMTCRNILWPPGMDLVVTKKAYERQQASDSYFAGRRRFGTERAAPLRCSSTRGARVDRQRCTSPWTRYYAGH
jgi:hypothetical protein